MMNAKSLLFVGALGLASLNIASARSYDIILNTPTMAGATELKPGEYKLKVEGSQAVFSDPLSEKKTWTAPVKIENSDRKFDQTVVETSNQGNMANIRSIDLGGTHTKLKFGQ